jgi:hypothetical protein
MASLRRVLWTGLGILSLSAALAQAGSIDVHGGGGTFVSALPGEPPQSFQTNTLIYSFLDEPPSYLLGRAVFEFDLANRPGDLSLGHIELSLHQKETLGTPGSFSIYGFDGDGYFYSDQGDQTLLASGVEPDSNGLVALDVTPFVTDLVARGVPWAGFSIRGDHESSYVQDGVLITSGFRSFADVLEDGGELAPTLHFRDVPEPPAAAGVLLLLLCLVARVTASAS